MIKGLTEEQLKNIKYVNPITQTHFSIPMGVGNVKAHMKRAVECGFTGFSITDTCVMGGVLEAYKLSRDKDFLKKLGKESLPLMVGVKLNVIDDLERKDKVNKFFNVTAYAMNITGYKNLTKLVALSSLDDHFYEKPRISLQELIENNEGLVVTSGNINGMVAQSIVRETNQEDLLMQIFKQTFGDRFYIEMHFHSLKMQWDRATKTYVSQETDIQKIVNLKLVDLSKRYGVKCVLVQNSYMPLKKHHSLQDILIANHPAYKDGWKFHNSYYTMSVKEMYEYIQKEANYISDEQFVEWCENTQEILEKTKNLKLSFSPALPTIQYNESDVNKDSKWEVSLKELEEKMKTVCPRLEKIIKVSEKDESLRTALKIIIKNNKIDLGKEEYCDRLAMELEVIQRNGIIKLSDYFLLLEDVTNYLRTIGKLRGFGRGCLTYDAPVLTSEGVKKLGEVKEGDKVYTHTGELKPVIKTFKYKVKEKLLEVNSQNSWNTIRLTKDHKVYGVKRKIINKSSKRRKYEKHNHNPTFMPISEFKVGDLLFLRKPKKNEGKIDKILNLEKYFDETVFYKKNKKTIIYVDKLTKTQKNTVPKSIKIDSEFLYMIGKWIGDGWLVFNK